MKQIRISIAVIVLLCLIVFGWYQHGYNEIVKLDQNVKSSWAQVESQLQRRFDLIPNLVRTVKGYSEHERGLFENVASLRSQWAQASSVSEKVEAANALAPTITKLLLVFENYPNLKANENFLALQSQLEGTENRLAVERRRYNQAVEQFNAYQQSFFGRFFANQTGKIESATYFKAVEAASTTVPEVNF